MLDLKLGGEKDVLALGLLLNRVKIATLTVVKLIGLRARRHMLILLAIRHAKVVVSQTVAKIIGFVMGPLMCDLRR